MRSFATIAALLIGLGLAGAAFADELPPVARAHNVIEPDKLFSSLVAKGDKDRAAGRLVEAAETYVQALAIERDPIIVGRLGVLLVGFERYEEAVELLSDALQRATLASESERQEFFQAFNKAFLVGGWVRVAVSHPGAQIVIDGVAKNPSGYTGFLTFLRAGGHELHATLEGYEDVKLTFETEKAKEKQVKVEFVAVPAKHIPPDEPKKRKMLRSSVKDPWGDSAKTDPYSSEYPQLPPPEHDDANKRKGTRWLVFGGPVVVFGVASWKPAVGAVMGGAVRPNEYVSVGLEGRAAWLTSGVADEPISAMTAGAVASLCGHYKWFFGCGLGHLGVINVAFSELTFVGKEVTFFKPGAGARIGAQLRLWQGLTLSANIDALALRSPTRLVVGQKIIADQPAVMLNADIRGGWEF